MGKGPEIIYTKSNHILSFILGLAFGISLLLIGAFILMYWLKINPDPFNLDLSQYVQESVIESNQAGLQGINLDALKFSDTDHILGAVNSGQTLVTYLDLQDAHSARQYAELKKLQAAHPKKVKIVWRHFPLNFHAQAQPAALASECARAQAQFFPFVDALYGQTEEFSSELYLELATQLNLDLNQFQQCLADPQGQDKLQQEIQAAIDTGITGTPNLIYLSSQDNTFKYIGGFVSQDYLAELIN